MEKVKIIIMFHKVGRLQRNLNFYYIGIGLAIMESFSYLDVIYTPSGSFSSAESTLAGQPQKVIVIN